MEMLSTRESIHTQQLVQDAMAIAQKKGKPSVYKTCRATSDLHL